ncbi:MAG TPA: D-TA family PLP-dependent enzyme [Chryseosolibacter sp.]
MADWYSIENIDTLDSPCLVVYPERIQKNIHTQIASIDDVSRLRPHIKTHKSYEVSKMMLEAGIKKFKCATIAEAEMLASAGVKDILLAYQPVGPKANRLATLVREFPDITWACLVDDLEIAKDLSYVFDEAKLKISVYIDLNVGMNRTGISPADAFGLFDDCKRLGGINIVGLHAYDGHLRDTNFEMRTKMCDEGFEAVRQLRQQIESSIGRKITVVAGGTPTFSIHKNREDVECSPGTYIYWDKGYEDILKEQHYLHAALVVSRVVSIPAENTICVDLGHKAIAAENPLPNRVHFLNAPELQPIGHSEEHMVFRTVPGIDYKVGDVLYGVPFHVCPTVALHEIAHTVVDGMVSEKWRNAARRRKLTI